MRRLRVFTPLWAAAILLVTSAAQAHFIFLLPQTDAEGKTTVQVFFGDGAYPDNPALLGRVADLQAWQLQGDNKPVALKAEHSPEQLVVPAQGEAAHAVFIASKDLGILTRGENSFSLQYYAKTGPELGHARWKGVNTASLLKLDIQPEYADGAIRLTVLFNGQPVEGAQVVYEGGELKGELTTDAKGQVAIATREPAVYSIRARHIDPVGGEKDGKTFSDTRHYSTLAIQLPVQTAPGDSQLAVLDSTVTSFGAATTDGALYVYGGHSGSAHSYSNKEQGDTLLRLSLDGSGAWEKLAKGPALQGLSMVAHGGKLYRIGGFTAMNEAGQDHNLVSQADVARFDPATGHWTALAPLPEPRSSYDAAVIGDTIYVVGGWQLRGKDSSVWHKTAWKMNLSQAEPKWEALPEPPFARRALAVAELRGKLYVIGGMQERGGPTKRVDVFDPQTGTWSQGPDILGEKPLTGFGPAAFAQDGVLYVSTSEGKLQRLSADGQSWEIARDLPTARFFHRMLPAGNGRLVVVGGANMGSGKFEAVELISVAPTTTPATTAAN